MQQVQTNWINSTLLEQIVHINWVDNANEALLVQHGANKFVTRAHT